MPARRSLIAATVVALAAAVGGAATAGAAPDRPSVVTGAEFDAYVAAQSSADAVRDQKLSDLESRVSALESGSATPTPTPTPTPTADPTTEPPPPTDGPYIAYEPGSFFNTPLPDDAPVDPESAQGIAYAKANNNKAWPTIRGVDGNPWGMVYAQGTCADPIWKFPADANLPNTVQFLATQGFHAPTSFGDKVSAASNGDQPIVVIDTCGVPAMAAGFTLWGANVDYDGNSSRTLSTSAGTGGNIVGGAFQHDSNGLDQRVPGSDSTLNERSRGAIPDAMVIRDDLLAYGETGGNDGTLGHVLHLFWHEPDSSAGHVLPMAGDEGGKSGWGPEGIRIRVKPSWTPPADCTGAARVVARTFQSYGAYIGDTSGGNSGVKAEQGSGMLHIDSLKACVSWDDMEFVQRGWTP